MVDAWRGARATHEGSAAASGSTPTTANRCVFILAIVEQAYYKAFSSVRADSMIVSDMTEEGASASSTRGHISTLQLF